jgi:hypothetical protein
MNVYVSTEYDIFSVTSCWLQVCQHYLTYRSWISAATTFQQMVSSILALFSPTPQHQYCR